MAILAIDQGSSATKAIAFDAQGRELGRAAMPVQIRHGADAAVEYDPEEILQSLLVAGRGAMAIAREPIEAIGIGNQGETVLAWDPDSGRALGAAVSWQDRRARSVTKRLAAHDERLRAISGLALDPYFAGPKMRWLRDQGVAGGVVTTIDSWLIYRLTGEFVTDAATASRTLLLDLASSAWSDEAFDLLGLAGEGRPRIVDCAGEIGRTTAFGFDVALTAAIVDQPAALWGLDCRRPGEAKCTYGTGAFVMANAGRLLPRSTELPGSIAWRLSGSVTYCLDGPVYAAAATVTWLQQLGLLRSAAEIDALAAGRGAPKTLFVPALAGSGPPTWSPQPAGAWFRLSLATGREDLVCAAVWGIAAEVAALAALMERDLGRPIERLRVDGGLAASDSLLQAQSDLLRIPVERGLTFDATAVGIAALASIGHHGGLDFNPRGYDSAPATVFEPRLSEDEAREWFVRWQAAAASAVGISESGR